MIRFPFPLLAVEGDSISDEITHLEEEEKEPTSEPAALDPVPDTILSSTYE